MTPPHAKIRKDVVFGMFGDQTHLLRTVKHFFGDLLGSAWKSFKIQDFAISGQLPVDAAICLCCCSVLFLKTTQPTQRRNRENNTTQHNTSEAKNNTDRIVYCFMLFSVSYYCLLCCFAVLCVKKSPGVFFEKIL